MEKKADFNMVKYGFKWHMFCVDHHFFFIKQSEMNILQFAKPANMLTCIQHQTFVLHCQCIHRYANLNQQVKCHQQGNTIYYPFAESI